MLSQPDWIHRDAINEDCKKAANGVPDDQSMKETFDARELVHSENWSRVMGVPKED